MDPGENLSHRLKGECDEKVSRNAGTKEACLLFHAPEVQRSQSIREPSPRADPFKKNRVPLRCPNSKQSFFFGLLAHFKGHGIDAFFPNILMAT